MSNTPEAPAKSSTKRGRMRTTLSDLERRERDLKCVEMRKQAIDWQTIADTLGYASTGHAHDRFVKIMMDYPRADVEQMRDLEVERLERDMAALTKIIADDRSKPSEIIRAVEVRTKVSERLARLTGQDRPERKQLTVVTNDALTTEIQRLEQEMERKAQLAKEQGIPALDQA